MVDQATLEREDVAEPPIAFRDERGDVSAAFIEAIEQAVAASDAETAQKLTGTLHEADLGSLIETLDRETRADLIRLLGDEFDYTTLTELDETTRVQILEDLTPAAVAEGVRDLESDDAVTILEDLEPQDQAEILAQIPIIERAALSRALEYPEESAGRLMQTDFIAVPPFWTVGQTIDYMRESAEDLPEDFYEVFVVDPAYRPLGTVALNRLLRSQRPTKVDALIDEVRELVHASDDQEDVARQFERYNLVSTPVVDEAGRMVGIVTIDDIVDVIQEEAEEDLRALGGVSSDEELSDTFWTIARGRFTWLLVNLFTAILASAVIGLFEGVIQKMVALAVLMPIVASQGGNAGTQTMTVAVRALATRTLSPHNALRVVSREVLVGLLNGLIFAVIMGVIAYAWFDVPQLGIVIGLAMIANLVAAALAGILIPLALNRFGIDPAVASGAFVTTVTDVTGFFAFLALAGWWFGLR